MRKLLLASVATLGTVGLMGSAFAQSTTVVTTAPVALPPVPTQGQAAWTPAAAPPAGANNNNNYQAPALPGPVANPTPGTMVVHINGKVEVDGWGLWSSADKRSVTAPAGSPGGPALAAGAATLALLAALLRRTIIPKMDSLRAQMPASETNTIPEFRRMHVAAILANLAQLVLIVWSLVATSLQSRAGL